MMEYANLKGFEQFIVDRDMVPEAHRSFYMNWVRRFLNSECSALELDQRDKVECFAEQLARDVSVKDWQHRQALQAVLWSIWRSTLPGSFRFNRFLATNGEKATNNATVPADFSGAGLTK